MLVGQRGGGLGDRALLDELRAPVKRVTRSNTHVPFSPPMEQYILINADKVEAAARSLLTVKAPA